MSEQNRIRAGLLAGNVQCTKGFSEPWEEMSNEERDELIEQWQEILDRSDYIVEDIVASIASHELLGPSWRQLEYETQIARTGIFECILLNDLTHPDGSVSVQRKVDPE